MFHPEFPGIVIRAFPDIFCTERQFVVHPVLYENVVSLLYPDERGMGKIRIVPDTSGCHSLTSSWNRACIPFRLARPVRPSTSAASGMVMVDRVVIRGLLGGAYDKNYRKKSED